MTERASKVFDDSPNPGDAWDEVVERLEGLKAAVVGQDRDLFGREMGAYFFSLVNLARLWGFNSEDLLRTANKEFKDRCEEVEGESDASGIRPEGAASEKKGKGVLLKK